jgi:hypothetical protein
MPRLSRREDWPERLAEEIGAAQERPFSFGEHDCCAFAARCVRAMTGHDFMAEFASYGTQEQADAILAGNGGVQGILSHCLGEPIPVAFARRGDILITTTPQGDAAGVCIDHRAAFPTLRGLVYVRVLACLDAWEVG